MPIIKEIKNIFDITPVDQAILLKGIHGNGKSTIIKDHFESKGYRVVILFLGQCADSSDIIGLPTREDKIVNDKKFTITSWAIPHWWPLDENEKVVIFLDEMNRAKQDVLQCIQDMVLNRKLNGKALPKHTRIIAAINPLDDTIDYIVNALDVSLYDRFNIYDFTPTASEWIDYAMEKKFNKYVIGFINKNKTTFLDPPDNMPNASKGEPYPSRRSWERISIILNTNPELIQPTIDSGGKERYNNLETLILGIVGIAATSAFINYLKESKKNLSGATVITNWNSDVQMIVRGMEYSEIIHLNSEIAYFFEENEDTLFVSKSTTQIYIDNLYEYLKTVNPEVAANFFDLLTTANNKKKTWPSKVLVDKISDWFIDILNGKDKNQINPEDHFKDKDIDDILNP